MFTPRHELSNCRILLSNDDGIDAPGLKVLERIAHQLSQDVWIVAPVTEQSGAGHSLTLHQPLRPNCLGEKIYSVDGTPADCVLVAINHLMKEEQPDLILSGVNMGANLGEDVHYSGTVAAALEGTLLGIPGIALSQVFSSPDVVRWETAENYAPDIIMKCCAASWGKNILLNVNFPDKPLDEVGGLSVVRQGKHKIGDELAFRSDPRGREYLWIGPRRLANASEEGTDLHAIAEGRITVTPICVDLTHRETALALKKVLE